MTTFEKFKLEVHSDAVIASLLSLRNGYATQGKLITNISEAIDSGIVTVKTEVKISKDGEQHIRDIDDLIQKRSEQIARKFNLY